MVEETGCEGRIIEEEQVKEKRDTKGNVWRKIYFGGGAHFENWLQQCKEIYGEENLEIEEIHSSDLECFKESGEKQYRIWVRTNK